MSTTTTQYNPAETEGKWYAHWMAKNYFHSTPDEREPFTIVIPPPNVTGVLHMGHMLNNTIQDILIRKARLDGKNACWVPGTDHASIATEAKVVKRLREKGIKKSDLSREDFLKEAWKWKEEYGGIILDQLKRLGASCDWDRTKFTLDPTLSKAVTKIFVDLHKKGKLYRGLRMTNWDPKAQTVLSNEEVIHTDETSKLYHVRYKIEGTEDEWVTIATTRPETILADAAIAIHPDDERYTHLKGKRAIVPMVHRSIPIIVDKYVKIDFGTGALKVTPAHDMNDYEIGKTHNLEVIDMLHGNGRLKGPFYVGMDREDARKQIAKDLKVQGHIVKIENYANSVGRSERTNAVVEPRLTEQWFLKMDEFAKTALNAVESKEVKFFPEHFFNMYNQWLKEDNVRDWCISRQLWWGQQIPAWYYKDHVFVAETAEDALAQAKAETGDDGLTLEHLKRDEDCVDTWFSSWLWPMTVFDGFENQEELKYYYPTNTLVTGWDIMFFWVARMVMAGYEWAPDLLGEDFVKENGAMPFKDVYFTGMVRDAKGRKMSKSLGNSPDALALIDRYGADGVRFGMMSSGSAGNDIIFDAPIDPKTKKALSESQLCDTGKKFCNKMWQAMNMIESKEIEDKPQSKINKLAVQWLRNKVNNVIADMGDMFKDYRLGDAQLALYKLTWGDFCSWYLEVIKPPHGETLDKTTYEATIDIYEEIMILLHPFMPFVTEAIWHRLRDRKDGEDCTISTYPNGGDYDAALIAKVDKIQKVVTEIRNLRSSNGLSPKEALPLAVEANDGAKALYADAGMIDLACKMANLSELRLTETEVEKSIAFVSGTEKYFLEVTIEVDVEAEREKLEKELAHQRGFLVGVQKKLGNERFVGSAPEAVVARERQKLADGLERIKALEESLANLN